MSVLSIQDRTQQFFFGCPLSIIYGNVSNFEYQSDYNIMKKYPCVHDLYVPNYARKANMNTKKRHVGELQTADCLKTTFSLYPDFVESIFLWTLRTG